MIKDKMAFLHKSLSDLLFPTRCITCGHRTTDGCLCAPCRNSIPFFSTLFCPACERRIPPPRGRSPLRRGEGPPPRTSCCTSPKTALRTLGVASVYQNPVIKKAIWSFKYRGVKGLAEPLGDILASYATNAMLPYLAAGDARSLLITPIPLHPRRERQRGFNQAMLLAKALGEKLDVEVRTLLERKRFQKAQVEIGNLQERRTNIAGAFSLAPHAAPFENKTIILVDDVATTGATLEEAARTLRAGGAKKIYGLVVCRG